MKDPLRIFRAGIDTTSGRWLATGLCQNVEWVATPVSTNKLTHPTTGRLQPADALLPLNGREIALRQIGDEPIGVCHLSMRLPQASYNAPLEIIARNVD